jgi:acyl carrier protein
MESEQIQQKIYEFVLKEFKPAIPIDRDSLLVEEGIIDSLAVFALIGFIDEQFGVKVDPQDVTLENFTTVVAISELVVSSAV